MNTSFRRALTIAGILVLWLGAMAWLVFTEAYPDLLNRTSPGYQTVLSQGVMIMDRWMTISHQGHPIGYTHTSVDVDQKGSERQYHIENRTLLTLTVMGRRQRIAVTADAGVDPSYALKTFTFSLSSSGYTLLISGRRKRGDEFEITVRGPGTTQHLTVAIPPDAVLYSPMTEMSLKALTPGRHLTLRIFNPVTLTSQSVPVRALRRDTILHRNQPLETMVLAARMDGMETLSWMDDRGTMIRQTTPFGWSMESCDAREALRLNSGGGTEDMLAALAVPIRGDVRALSSGSSSRLRLNGVAFTRDQLETQRQDIITLGTNTAEITVRSETLPPTGCARDAIPTNLTPWLASTAFIQARDPRLIRQAHEITGDWTNSLEAAMAIYHWVNTHVRKSPTVSLPSALEVLLRPEGDCNEHTYLFVGLARAAGLPARIRVGVTLHEGRFYYHAWPSVYVGQWLDMDPTRGLPAVNAGYISLLEGELAEQMRLMSVIGQLRVDIL